ncbi:uncharacterized protein ISCGN_025087 [Ixodes scapularis]
MDKKCQKLKNYSARISRLFPRDKTARQIFASLRSTKSALSARNVDYDQPCTGSDVQCCHILDDLSFWNELLWLCHLEMREEAPGELGTDCLVGFTPIIASEAMCCHAHIILHWLLTEHHCIKTLKVKGVVAHRNPRLFLDALRLNNGLRRLELHECDLEDECKTRIQDASQYLVVAIGTLTGLEELVLHDVFLSQDALALLGTAFENMPCLRFFSASLGYMSAPKTDVLIRSLKRSKTIKALHCNDWCLHHGKDTTFAEYLAEHVVLQELVINITKGFRSRTEEVKSVLEVLATNRVLRKLHLVGHLFEPSQGPLLSKVMATNNTLQSFRTYGNKCTFEDDSLAEIVGNNTGLLELEMENIAVVGVEKLAEAIRTNTTMKKLSLCCSELSLEDITKLCEALAKNSWLQTVTGEEVNESLVADVYKVLRETGTDQRMKFRSVIKSPFALQEALEHCHELTEVDYHPAPRSVTGTLNSVFGCYFIDELDSEDEVCIHRYPPVPKTGGSPAPEFSAFSCLTSCSQLMKLEITLAEEMSTSCAELLAQFLSSTKKLRHADLNFPTTISATQILLDAMSRNNSVSTLILSNWHFLSYHAEDFAETLGRNETLNYLELHLVKAGLILNELSATVEGNKFLVSIKVDDDCHVDDEVWMFKVMDVLRRNFSLLQRAVHFVMGRCDKRCGEAFEEVFRSRALSEKVQQLSGGSESDTEERIRKARRHLDANFMVVAGVVSEAVVCDGGRLGQMRLDQIGLDNWLRVRSYLKLTDIKDMPTTLRACELTKGF